MGYWFRNYEYGAALVAVTGHKTPDGQTFGLAYTGRCDDPGAALTALRPRLLADIKAGRATWRDGPPASFGLFEEHEEDCRIAAADRADWREVQAIREAHKLYR